MDPLCKFQSLVNEELDGILLTSRENRRYCTGYDVAEGMALITKTGSRYYYTDSRYLEAAQQNLRAFTVIPVTAQQSYSHRIAQAAQELNLRRLGFEEEDWSVGDYLRFQQTLKLDWSPVQRELDRFRQVKEPEELVWMRKAQAITDKTFSQLLTVIAPGMTEKDLEAELIYRLYRNGAEGLSFDPIVVSGPNTSLPHGVPGLRKLQPGDFVTMDFGCLSGGYCSDMTRTVALGFVTPEMERVYETVLRAQKTAIGVSRAGMTGRQIDDAARTVIQEAGYGAYFGHGYGHSLGLKIHENPNCNPSNDQPIPAGAVCSAEPGIYLPGRFGVRIEDVVIFREDGVEDITGSPKELQILSC